MNISTEHVLQCNQSEPLADANGRIVDLMNENDFAVDLQACIYERAISDIYMMV